MDVRDLFAMIGRLYAANVELTEEGDKLKNQVMHLEREREDLRSRNEELKGMWNIATDRLEELEKANEEYMEVIEGLNSELASLKRNDCVDARREEETLKEDEF